MDRFRSYWDLLTCRMLFELRKDARQFYIGPLWWILEPAAQIVVLYIIFGILLDRGGTGFVGFLTVGFVFWRWFESSCKSGEMATVHASPVLTHARVAAWLFPVSHILSLTVRFLVVLVLLSLFAAFYSGQVGVAYLALPPVLLLNLVLILSIGTFLSVLPPFFPDITKITDNLFTLMFFCSGIFFNIRDFSPAIANIFYLNPVAAFLTIYRGIMLEGQLPALDLLLRVTALTAAAFLIALLTHRAAYRRGLVKALLRQ